MFERELWEPLYTLAGRYGAALHKDEGETGKIREEFFKLLIPQLYDLGKRLLKGNGFKARTPQGNVSLSLQGANTTVDDLVQEGAIGVLRSLNHYDAQRGDRVYDLMRYIKSAAALAMYQSVERSHSVASVSYDRFRIVLKYILTGEEKEKQIKTMEEQMRIKGRKISEREALWLYFAVTGKYVPLEEIAEKDDSPRESDSFMEPETSGILEELKNIGEKELLQRQSYTILIEEEETPDERIFLRKAIPYVGQFLKKICSTRAEILRWRYGIGNKNEITAARIAKALNVSETTVNQQLIKGRQELRRLLKKVDITSY